MALPSLQTPSHWIAGLRGALPAVAGGKGEGADAHLLLCPQKNTQNLLESPCAPSDAPRRIAQRGAAIIITTQRQKKKKNQRLILKTLL